MTALDRAAGTFLKLAAQVEKLAKKIDDLDGKRATVEAEVKTDKAEREIGAFATDLKRKMDAAIKSIPEIEIDADSSDAQREMAEIRREMESLRDQEIGVDLTADDAMKRVAELRSRLERLSDVDIDIEMRANAGAALAQLGAINAGIDKLDGKKVEVKFDVDRGLGETILKIAALGRALQFLALPAAAIAAGPQLAALGAAVVQATGSLYLVPAAAGAAILSLGTLKVAFTGFGDAMKALDDPGKFAEAVGKLAPNARAAATAIRDLANGAFKELRLDVQNRLFATVGEQIRGLASTYLPMLRSAMGQVADAFSKAFTITARFLQQPAQVNNLRVAFSNLGVSVENISKVVQPLTSAFLDIFTVGATRLPSLTAGLAAAAERFAVFMETARQSGQLGQWLDTGINTVKLLGQTLGNVGSSILSIFRAASAQGASFVQVLAEATGQMAAFLKSAQGQQALGNFFGTIRAALDAVKPAIAALLPLFLELIQIAGTDLVRVFQEVGPPLEAVATSLTSALLPVLPAIGAALAEIAVAMTPIIFQAAALAPAFQQVAQAVAALLQAAAPFATAFANTMVSALAILTPALKLVAEALAGIAPLLGVISPLLGTAAAGFLALRAATTGINMVQGVLAGIATQMTNVAGRAGDLAEKFTGAAAAKERVVGVGERVSGMFTKLGSALPVIGVALVGIGLAYEEFGGKADQVAGKVINGSLSMQAAIAQEAAQIHKNQIEWLGGMNAQESYAAAAQNVTAEVDRQIAALSPMQQLQARVAMAQTELNDAVAQYGPHSQEAAAAGERLGAATRELETAQAGAEAAANRYNQTLQDQVQAAQSALGANLALEDAIARVGEAQERANEAAKRHGAGSAEAAEANRNLVQSIDQAAQAAQRKAEADNASLGPQQAANAGSRAYATTLLQTAATLSGPAREGALKYLATLSQVELDSLSAAAATSGFKTEVITLPGGKTVKIAVDPETGKVVEAKTLLDSIQDKTVNFIVRGNVDDVTGKITQVVQMADGSRGTMIVDAQADPATGKINGVVQYGNGQTAAVSIDGNQEPVNGKINAVITYADGTTAIIQVDAEPGLANEKIAGLRTSASAKVTFPVDSDVGPAKPPIDSVHAQARRPQSFNTDSNVGAARGAVEGVHSLARIKQSFDTDSNPSPARGQVNRVQGEARRPQSFNTDSNTGPASGRVNTVQSDARRPQSFNVDARTESAATKLGNLVSQYISRTFTWTVNIIQRIFGAEGMVYPGTGYAGGGNRDVGGTPTTVRQNGPALEADGRRLRPASNRRAMIAGAGSWRVFGDAPIGDEFFLPDNNAPFTMALGAEWANRRGMVLVPKDRLVKLAGGGMVRHGEVSAGRWNELKAQGWKGRAGDRMEALYAPSSGGGGGGGSLGTLGISVKRMAAGGIIGGRAAGLLPAASSAGAVDTRAVAELQALRAEMRAVAAELASARSVTYAPTINNPVAEPASATQASDLRTATALRVLG